MIELSFERDIKPLFSERDRAEMEWAFDLWSYEEVVVNAEQIHERLADGSMPCFGSWDDSRIRLFHQWMTLGFPK